MSPDLSVVVYCRDHAEELPRCLSFVRAQRTDASFEVIVVLAGASHFVLPNETKVVRAADSANAGVLRNAGIKASKGKHVAFLPSSLTVPEDWMSTLIDQHAHHIAVVGAIGNGEPNSRVATAGFICERNIWLTLRSGPIDNAPAVNASYSRALFDAGARFPDLSTEADIHFHTRLRTERGIMLQSVPRLCASYHGERALSRFLHHNFIEGKRYTNWRRESGRLGWPARLMLLGLWWFIPLRLAQRTLTAARHDRAMQTTIRRNLPLVLFGWTARALGEVIVCFGPGSRANQSQRSEQ